MSEENNQNRQKKTVSTLNQRTYQISSTNNMIVCSYFTKLSNQSWGHKLLYSLAIMLISGSFYFFINSKIPIIDNNADNYFTSTSQQALVTYASSRGLNAILSTIEEMGLSLPIFGEVPVGNLIEPIDDLTERLSTIMLYSISSLGLQKIFMEISMVYSFKLIALCLLLLILALWIPFLNSLLSDFIFKTVLILLAIRFFLPLSALANSLIQEEFFEEKIQTNVQVLSSNSIKNEENSTRAKSTSELIFSVSYAKKLKEQSQKILSNGKEIVNALIQLTILYSSSFIIQVVLIPFLSFYFLLKFFDKMLTTKAEFELKSAIQPKTRLSNDKAEHKDINNL